MTIKEYAIAVLPSYEVAKKITDINKKIADHLVPQGLEHKPNKCHVTLYHGAYDDKDLLEIRNQLAEKAYSIKSLTLNFKDEIVVVGPNRWIDINIKRSDENNKVIKQDYESICDLHYKVVNTFSEYHQRPLERASKLFETLKTKIAVGDKDALKIAEQIDTYGVSGVKELYNPHTTIWYQWPTDSALNKAAETVKDETSDFSCDAWALVLGELGFNGNIERIYAIFPLCQETDKDEAVKLAAETQLDW